MIPEAFTVKRRRKETADTFTVELERTGSDFLFEPGQFNMLYMFGVGEVPISISRKAKATNRLEHTIRDVGAVTSALASLRNGDELGIRGPFGTSWPVREAEGKDVLMAAGGIGLAPLRPAIEHILDNRQKYGRVVILYGARTPDDLLYPKDLAKWSARLDVDVLVTVDRASRQWRGSVGVITTLVRTAPIEADDAVAMICGPEVMMHFVTMHLAGRGFTSEQMYVSMERNMQCAEGRCGHCQFGPMFVCKDGPVFRFDDVEPFFNVKEF